MTQLDTGAVTHFFWDLIFFSRLLTVGFLSLGTPDIWGQIILFRGRGRPMHCRMFICIPDFYPVVATKNVSRLRNIPYRGKIIWFENHSLGDDLGFGEVTLLKAGSNDVLAT